MNPNQFTGLKMPVFTAFGWASEDTAINFALSQLELFVRRLYGHMPREIQALLPYCGLDRSGQNVYLSSAENANEGVSIVFFARPLSLEIALMLRDKKVLNRGLKIAASQTERFHRELAELGNEWQLLLRQMEYDPESGDATNYQELFKETVGLIETEPLNEMLIRAEFLNSSPNWIVPIIVSRRIKAEQVAAMGMQIIDISREYLIRMLPLLKLVSNQLRKERPAKATKAEKAVAPQAVAPQNSSKLFSYELSLKPIHIRRGFLNLTPRHWPVFAKSARAETCEVTLLYADKTDPKTVVWRLKPHDQARIVLNESAQQWLEANFNEGDKIKIGAVKNPDGKITITVVPSE